MSDKNSPLLVVGVGASAGGLDSLKRFFTTVPKDAPIAFIVVQHLDPNHKSMMADILARQTPFSFCQAKHDQSIEAGMGYLIPPNAYIEVIEHTIKITKPQHQRGSRLAIDHLFRSMAEVYQTKAVGLVFSGSGSDGTAGLRALKAAGGLSVVQTPQQAEYPSMPRSAIDAGVVDQVMNVEDIYSLLLEYAEHPYHDLSGGKGKDEDEEGQRTISSLLKTQENFDLDQYKQATVQRRLLRRMSLTSNTQQKDYIKLLRESKNERQFLMRDLLINVTDFFRDKEAFALINEKVIHNIVGEAQDGSDIRVWVAGCASGEEAYTMAILFTEHIELSGKTLRLKIFATDVDEEAIRIARKGVYPDSITSELPDDYLENYFTLQGDGYYAVNSALRDCISFAHQNVYTDPPFSKMHLVSCRNLLIYFRKSVQQKVLQSFYFALMPSGYLFLGSSESLGEQKALFKPISQKWRIFSRKERNGSSVSSQISALPSFFNRGIKSANDRRPKEYTMSSTDKAKFSLLVALNPCVLLDDNNRVVYFHGNVDHFLQLPMGDAELNFFNMLATELRTRMRGGIYKARKSGDQVLVNPPRQYKPRDNNKKLFKSQISPIVEADGSVSSLVISFEEIKIGKQSSIPTQEQLESKDQETMVEAMEKELAETKEELQNTTEELETSTEELKAAHEEALSTNEELQSSNEELEASTEELRSLNEELTTVNAQLKDKIDELSTTHDDIKNFLASTNLATVFLSNELKVKRYTPAAERLLRIGSQDIDRPLQEISRQFIDQKTLDEAQLVLESLESSEKEIEVDGRWFLQKILPYKTEERRVDGVVLTFNDITHLKKAVNSLKSSGNQHAVIATLGLKALSSDNMDNLMDQLVREVAHTLNADLSKVLEYFPGNNNLLLKAGIGWDKGLVGHATVEANIASQAGFTLNCRAPVIVDELALEQRFSGPSLLTDHKVVSGMSCVIENGEHPWGILAVHTLKRRQFTQDDANFLTSAANILSVALHRTAIEAKLRDSEKRLRIAKNSNNMGSFEFMLQTGEISWDQLLVDIWGVNGNDVTFYDFMQGVHPDDVDHINDAIETSMKLQGDGHYKATYRVIHKKSKRVTWVEATGQVLFQNNQAHKMIGMVIDITEKMSLESSLKAAVRQLQETNERKNEFLATLGHEIRNPLAAIASGVQIIERDKKQLGRGVNMIQNNIHIVSLLLDDLLDLTRISRGQIELKKQTINFNELVSDIYHSFLPQCQKKQQKISLKLPVVNIIGWADKTRLMQAFGNIVSNAHKFTPKDGSISVELRQVDRQLEVTVKDTGIGLDMQYKEKIFEPFQQLKQNQSIVNSGLGIGLSLVKQFVALHEGTVALESDGPNMGSTFTVSLPIINNPSDDAINSKTTQNKSSHSSSIGSLDKLNILIVDDNEDAAYGLSLILQMKGCQVHSCHTATAALAEFKDFNPNVLILDIGLPDMTGYELFAAIKRESTAPSLNIALTGFGHKKARDSSKKAGFDYHMTKPVDIEELLHLLSEYAM
ncbi:CheR family methyltransferase [Paraglaciecola sp.]|uniref:CheR family methyltransferase n=1 Tax=Paraglaciecola sp. TaxID=1920173 RepID=UPI0030F3CC44